MELRGSDPVAARHRRLSAPGKTVTAASATACTRGGEPGVRWSLNKQERAAGMTPALQPLASSLPFTG
jgi:hypothetical protein